MIFRINNSTVSQTAAAVTNRNGVFALVQKLLFASQTINKCNPVDEENWRKNKQKKNRRRWLEMLHLADGLVNVALQLL